MAKKADKSDSNEDELAARVDDMMKPEDTIKDKPGTNVNVKKIAVSADKDEDVKTAPELPKAAEKADLEADDSEADEAMEKEDITDDQATDKAVEDIVAKEGDTVLAVEDAKKAKKNKANRPTGWKDKLRRLLKNKWIWVGVLAVIVILLLLPFTRYHVLGLVIKKTVPITVVDSQSNEPVSSASVSIGGKTAETDGNGQAKIKTGLGKHDLAVSKQYYSDSRQSYFVGFKSPGNKTVKLVATGRLVQVTVTNSITGKPLVQVAVKVFNTSARTNGQGKATIALPAKAATYQGKLSLAGYNDQTITVRVTNKTVKANDFDLTPAGHVYFLSNKSGKLDVVKSNLDGGGRTVVLPGTGQEDPNNTNLLAARDWRFAVLKANRGGHTALYLIDTSTDKVTQFDNTDANFNLIGWYGHYFTYSFDKINSQPWQSGIQQVKSYDADHQQLNLLDQTSAEGTDNSSWANQNFSDFFVLDNKIVYTTQWFNSNRDVSDKSNTIRSIEPNGQNKKDIYSISPAQGLVNNGVLYSPTSIYFSGIENNQDTFYNYQDGSVSKVNIDITTFNKTYPTFILSPSGKKTLWNELRDGKDTLFTGDDNAGQAKAVDGGSGYAAYGWYSDNYALVTKNSSELYVLAPGISKTPLKVTDYYKPPRSLTGYGYGYGGL